MNVAKYNTPEGQRQSSPIITAILLLLAMVANLPFFQMERASAQAGTNITTEQSIKPTPSPAAESAKMPGDLSAIINSSVNKDVRQDVIVQFFGKLSVKHSNMIKKAGGTIKTRLEGTNSLLVSIPVSNLNKLAEDSQVVFITPDRMIEAAMDPTNFLVGTDKLRAVAPDFYGRTVFSANGYQTRGNSVMNPTSLGNFVGAETTQLLASQDDAPITGITNISSSSQYYPRQ